MQNRTRAADAAGSADTVESPAVVFENVSLVFDDHVVLRDLSFELARGSMTFLLGASGTGKSLTLKLILGLLKPDAGAIWVKGERVDQFSEQQMMAVRQSLGMVFQEGALFDSLTVRENVGYKLYEETDLPLDEVHARVEEVLGFVGLAEHIDKAPSALSGGQRRRVAIARAMTAKPPILLYDEPTTGLDPITSVTIDAEIIKLRDLENVSTIMVTHQLRDAFYVAEHTAVREGGEVRLIQADPAKVAETEFIMLRDGDIAFEGDVHELRGSRDPYLQSFLS